MAFVVASLFVHTCPMSLSCIWQLFVVDGGICGYGVKYEYVKQAVKLLEVRYILIKSQE